MGTRALVYGHVDLNLIDGSAIWVQGMVQALVAAGAEVDLLLKAPVRTTRLLEPLLQMQSVIVHRPYEDELLPGLRAAAPNSGLTPTQVSTAIAELDRAVGYDLLVVRGLAAVSALVEQGVGAGRLWTYLTDVPQSIGDAEAESVARLERIATASRFLLCQTEELRGFLEGLVPQACGRAVLLPPVLAPGDPGSPPAELAGVVSATAPLRLVYTGKFAPRWNTEQMTAIPAALASRGVPAELHMVGDKVHEDRADPGFGARMRHLLRHAEGVHWHGGLPRAEAMRIAATAHVGLSWRDADLDDSLELSTKVLEYGALGLPVLLNRTSMHERLLGADYPLFADAGPPGAEAEIEQVLDLLAGLPGDPGGYALARSRTGAAAAEHTLAAAATRIRGLLDRAFPSAPPVPAGRARPLRVVIAGHDLKFFTHIGERLAATPGIELRTDAWSALTRHDEERSRELAQWADVVFCEWCGHNAIWYSRHKRPGQRLIVRLHRFELFAGFPEQVRIDEVDAVVCVNRYYADLTEQMTGWPAQKITVIPNAVDVAQFDRPKLAGSRFHLGMIGIAPARKRMDLAVELLARLRRVDRRYHLFVKSKMPWDYWWVWKQPEERAHFDEVIRRVRTDPLVADAVIFDGYGADVAAWLRGIGWVVSTSDDESFHLSPAEGMASGAVPAVLPWPGARTVYDDDWVHDSVEDMAAAVLSCSDDAEWERQRTLAHRQVSAAYDLSVVYQAFLDLLTDTRTGPSAATRHGLPVAAAPRLPGARGRA